VNPNARAVAGVRTVTATIEDGAAAKLLRLFFFMQGLENQRIKLSGYIHA
jgi:hypothetical protein